MSSKVSSLSSLSQELSSQLHPVGVVMRSNAPLVDELLQEKAAVSDYFVAIEDTKSRRKLATTLGVASTLVALVSLLELFKFSR